MQEENIISLIKNNPVCFDRFTFDIYMRLLIAVGYSNEEAKDLILVNCFLSTLVFQERIENKFYLYVTNETSPDLMRLKKEIFFEIKYREINSN